MHRSIKAASPVMVICPAVCLLAHFPCVKHQERFQKLTRTIRPRTATSTFPQLLSSDFCSFSVALRPQRLLGTRTATSIFTRACVRAYVYLFRSVVETCNMAPAWLQLSMYVLISQVGLPRAYVVRTLAARVCIRIFCYGVQ